IALGMGRLLAMRAWVPVESWGVWVMGWILAMAILDRSHLKKFQRCMDATTAAFPGIPGRRLMPHRVSAGRQDRRANTPRNRLGDATAEPQGAPCLVSCSAHEDRSRAGKFLYLRVLYSGSVAELCGESRPLGART